MSRLNSENDIASLIETAENGPDLSVRINALEIASRLPLDRSGWSSLAEPARRILADTEPGSAARRETIRIAASLPLRSVRETLYELAQDADAPDTETIIGELADRGDPAALRACLDAVRNGQEHRFHQVARMPLEAEGLTHREIPKLPRGADPDAKFWRAIALARVGRTKDLDRVLKGRGPRPLWFDGAPGMAYGLIAMVRPIPDELREHLLQWLEKAAKKPDKVPQEAWLVAWALTGVADAFGQPIEPRAEPAPPPAPQPQRPTPTPQEQAAAESVANEILESLTPESPDILSADTSQLANLGDEKSADFIHDLIAKVQDLAQVTDFGMQPNIVFGNLVLNVVSEMTGFGNWPVQKLVSTVMRDRLNALDAGQAAWVIGRAEPQQVTRELSNLVSMRAANGDGELNLQLARALADELAGVAGTPWRGAGPEGGISSVAPQALIDDLPRAGAILDDAVGADADMEMAGPEPEAEQPSTEQRQVHAEIVHEDQTRYSFVAGAENLVRCRIALPDPQFGVATGSAVPWMEIPPGGLDLDVVLQWENQWAHGTLNLPADRSQASEACDLALDVPADCRQIVATIALLYRGRAFEVIELKAAAVPAGQEDPGPAAFHLDRVTDGRAIVENPDSIPVDAVLISGATYNDEKMMDEFTVQIFGSAIPHKVQLGRTETMIRKLNEELFGTQIDLVHQERRHLVTPRLKADNPDVERILRLLAKQGCTLYQDLTAQGLGDLGRRIQIINRENKTLLPLEFVYDRGYPSDTATVCRAGLDALESELLDCPECSTAPTPVGNRVDTICPFGFWSIRKVIERRDPNTKLAPGRTSLPSPIGGVREVVSLDSVLFASSSEVVETEQEKIRQVLAEHFASSAYVDSWDQWSAELRLDQRDVLLALPHHETGDGEYLEIGHPGIETQQRRLADGQITCNVVNPTERYPGPITLLIGCRTGTNEGYRPVSLMFKQQMTSIVVGTTAEILARHAAPVARELILQLKSKDLAAEDFGTVMHNVRRRMLARGYLMALCLVSFGDAEWRLPARND